MLMTTATTTTTATRMMAVLLAAGLALACSRAPAGAELQRSLVIGLGGYEDVPTREQLLRLGDEAQLVDGLVAIYRDPGVESYVRVRALTSLHLFPNATSQAVLEQALQAPETTDVARRTAVKAYGAGFGQAAVPLLGKLIDHPDLHTRNAAARMLGQIRGEPSLRTLRRRLGQEGSALVRGTIEAGLR
jgi:HEAT repeat protein